MRQHTENRAGLGSCYSLGRPWVRKDKLGCRYPCLRPVWVGVERLELLTAKMGVAAGETRMRRAVITAETPRGKWSQEGYSCEGPLPEKRWLERDGVLLRLAMAKLAGWGQEWLVRIGEAGVEGVVANDWRLEECWLERRIAARKLEQT